MAADLGPRRRRDRGAHLSVCDRRSGTVQRPFRHDAEEISKYQSGETDVSGRISKIGDGGVRTAVYEAANVILTRPVKGCASLKSWAMKLAKRAGMQKAKVALARKLTVIMHRMLADGTTFTNRPA